MRTGRRIFRILILFQLLLIVPFSLLHGQAFRRIYPRVERTSYRGMQMRADGNPGRPKIGLVLSGGGARGLAQIGVLKALERHHIPIDLIVGNSLGSIVGGLYASGYSIARIESIATHADWKDLLSFSEETKRTDLFSEQKESQQQGFLVIRFDGLEPVIPSSISGGQRLSNFFSYLTLQAPYHPNPSFDDLKIPFRATATDLISGKRVILDHGSLAEAMRASVTVPLLFSPIERDSMVLVDGGLVSNIPADVARRLGCTLVIAVNSTSAMRTADQMSAPWEIADQIMSIMMQETNQEELRQADVVITPESGRRIVSDFSGIDSLIAAGEQAGEELIPVIERRLAAAPPDSLGLIRFDSINSALPQSLRPLIGKHLPGGSGTTGDYQDLIDELSAAQFGAHPSAELFRDRDGIRAVITAPSPVEITRIRFTGARAVPPQVIDSAVAPFYHSEFTPDRIRRLLESVVDVYRQRGFSLARIDSFSTGESDGSLSFRIDEGAIRQIRYEGNYLTKDYIIRREYPLDEGEIFTIDKATRGVVNIKSTGLFEYVLLDIRYESDRPVIILRVKEKSPELLRIGLHVDDERSIVSTFDIRDANFRGAWEDLGLLARYGYRDRGAEFGYTIHRIFNTYFTLNLKSYVGSRDIFTYKDDFSEGGRGWDRIENGEYQKGMYGWSLAFGSHFERFGDVSVQFRMENQKVTGLAGLGYVPDQIKFASLRVLSTIDTENKFLFPTAGTYVSISYESATQNLGSEVGFGKMLVVYETYLTPSASHTFRPRITFGFADNTLPLTEQFTLGGRTSFYGLREDDSYGRQLMLMNMEYRYALPFKLIFDSYLKLRCDLGSISLQPQELKLASFRYAYGGELALDTPLGEASVGAGQSFYPRRDLPGNPIGFGPLLVYFSIGTSL